jgi:hypothetical protein
MSNVKKPTLRKGIQINPPCRTSLAAGYWGQDPKSTVLSTQTVERIMKNNTDLIRGMGVVADIWVEASENRDWLPVCSCVKTTNQSADQRCKKCYGTKRVPGFVKWGFNTMFYSAVSTGFQLPPTIRKKNDTTMHTLELSQGVLAAEFDTPDFSVNNPYSTGWELQTAIYNRANQTGNSIKWSIDGGTTWSAEPISTLHLERGNIRFRIRLERVDANALSPQFEILRLRHPIQECPFIKVARPMGTRKRSREVFGETENESGLSYWTVPIHGGAQVMGQPVYSKPWLPDRFLLEIKEGTFAGDRYVPVSYQRSEHIGVMTSQIFSVRRAQPDEIYGSVF